MTTLALVVHLMNGSLCGVHDWVHAEVVGIAKSAEPLTMRENLRHRRDALARVATRLSSLATWTQAQRQGSTRGHRRP